MHNTTMMKEYTNLASKVKPEQRFQLRRAHSSAEQLGDALAAATRATDDILVRDALRDLGVEVEHIVRRLGNIKKFVGA